MFRSRAQAESASRECEWKEKSPPFMFVACLAIADRKQQGTKSKQIVRYAQPKVDRTVNEGE